MVNDSRDHWSNRPSIYWVGTGVVFVFFAAFKIDWSWVTAAWVQAIGSVVAIFVAIIIGWSSLLLDKRNRRLEAQHHRQRILSGLYVEVFGFAARCARDADTWRIEVSLERKRAEEMKDIRPRRTIMELLKFEPSTPVVYPALAESHGLLDPDAQAALSEFYYRLDAVTRDIRRFALREWAERMEPGEIEHLAGVFYKCCEPAQQAIQNLRAGLDEHADLDRKLNESYVEFFQEPSPRGTTIDEVLGTVLSYGLPRLKS